MKSLKPLLLAVSAMFYFSPLTSSAQNRSNEDKVVKLDARHSHLNYRSGEFIVKFKPDLDLRVHKMQDGSFSSLGVSTIDRLLQSIGADEVDALMPLTAHQELVAKGTMSAGPKQVNLSKLYRVRYDVQKAKSLQDVIAQLEQLPDVEYAEPNYIFYTLGEPVTSALSDPLASQQWGMDFIGLNKLWNVPVIHHERPVIAILDTGVDLEHPDLRDNLWTNATELNGYDNLDDDVNGLVDDLHGWDFVRQTGLIRDWNGHGTHCAGVAAAVGENGVGIQGANPDALLMPVTVIQSDGSGDIATLVKGIDYAIAKGADVINMSFGSYTYSQSQQEALQKASKQAVLVAAAGNDCRPINPSLQCPVCHAWGAPMFPAAFSFVLGVQACSQNGTRASFSNYDNDGPVYSEFSELYNYEILAPGVDILSTYPGGQYKAFNGTSMSCPMVSGAISRLLQCKDYSSNELMLADLLHTSNQALNVYSAYQVKDKDRKPELCLINYVLDDLIGGDRDFHADAGDTIRFYPVFRNAYGAAENIQFTLKLAPDEDPDLIEFLDKTVDFGASLNSYDQAKSKNPLRFRVSNKCTDGSHLKLQLSATCNNSRNKYKYDLDIPVEKAQNLGGVLTEDMTLYPDVQYIINSSLAVPANVTLTIKPGTVIKMRDYTGFSVVGNLVCKGKPDSLIVFTKAKYDNGDILGINVANDVLEYVKFDSLYNSSRNPNTLEFNGENCIITNIDTEHFVHKGKLVKSNIYGNHTNHGDLSPADCAVSYKQCNFIGNTSEQDYVDLLQSSNRITSLDSCNNFANWSNSSERYFNGAFYSEKAMTFKTDTPSYWGSADEKTVRKGFYDMYTSGSESLGIYDMSNMLTRPSDKTHGLVWKVLVDGYDAQDQFSEIPPLGIGKHKFEVYFNRPMDVSVAPNITMGLNPPYTQHVIAENASWNADSTRYTAYLNITGKTSTDGLNRICVAGARDNEFFEIPIEKYRFNVNVSAVGSMATGLVAEPGLGKVTLNWVADHADQKDLMGYTISRFTDYVDSVYVEFDEFGTFVGEWKYIGDTVTVNRQMLSLDETTFVDYDVVPGTTYYYILCQMTTGMSNYHMTNPVAAVPLTADKGDANGSMNVDVADVVTEIAWLTNQDPKPFIFDAADVNTDKEVNILDVVGTINIITTPFTTDVLKTAAHASAQYFVENGVLYVETPVTLGGVQVTVNADKNQEITVMDDLKQFEQTGVWQNDNQYLFLAYSMSGLTLEPGRHALLRLGEMANVKEIILSDARGSNVLALNGNATGIGQVEAMQLQAPTPNPFKTVLHIPYVIAKDGNHDVEINISEISGRVVHTARRQCGFGEYAYTWQPEIGLQQGLYLVSLVVDGHLMQTVKVLYLP